MGSVTTSYLVDTLNPTGHAQVMDELVGGAVTRTYTYGRQHISENRLVSGAWTPSFYGYDGGGSVRQLTNTSQTVTDTYDYDAFGNLVNQTGTTPNNYLYRGEQYDADLNLYYLRARWYNPVTGRFMTRDPYAGSLYDPASLHRYNYARSNPSNYLDPSGRAALAEFALDLISPKRVAQAMVLYVTGKSVECMLRTDAAVLYLVGEFSGSNDTIIDAKANFQQWRVAQVP